MPISASWLWLVAGLDLLFEICRGWRRAVLRHGVSVVALLRLPATKGFEGTKLTGLEHNDAFETREG